MVAVHITVGAAVIALNLIAGGLGGIGWLRRVPSIPFWYFLRAAQVSVFIQVSIGFILVSTNHEPPNNLHYLYGALPLFVSLLAETIRAGAASQEIGEEEFRELPAERQQTLALAIVRREMGVMAVSCLVVFFLALRAAGTSGLL